MNLPRAEECRQQLAVPISLSSDGEWQNTPPKLSFKRIQQLKIKVFPRMKVSLGERRRYVSFLD